MCGHSSNDIASALIQILEGMISEPPKITEIISCSDCCVPQNRNSDITILIADFLKKHPNVQTITMKYSLPGHTCIQVVDNVHWRIEKNMKVTYIWSRLSFVKIDNKRPFSVINMKTSLFKNYKKSGSTFKYNKILYTKVRQLRFLQGDQFGLQCKSQ